ncbi:reverse transcriptase domain-containing protein [Staphylococcus aureus]
MAKIDLNSGYWQVGLHPEDKEKTAFSTGEGLWQFRVMPFGLCNAPTNFECLMAQVLKDRSRGYPTTLHPPLQGGTKHWVSLLTWKKPSTWFGEKD